MTELHQNDATPSAQPEAGPGPDAPLVEQLRQGEPEASHRFVREHYPGIYRYLLYLTGRREAAEDPTQETFLQAWRRLETFDDRGPLRPWLHRIAHRQFLQALRSQRPEASLEEMAETPAPHGGGVTEVELRSVMAALPSEQREALVLHTLEGYSYQEIARIVDAPLSTVKYRLTAARARLQRELGEGDLPYLNEAAGSMRQWSWLPLEEMSELEAQLAMGSIRCSAFGVRSSGQAVPSTEDRTPNAESVARLEETMERREFLRHAAVGAAGMMLPAEKEVVDDRLTRKVTLAVKATALSDLCDHLRSTAGIHLVAGNSVADEKVTVFCQKLPLREVMRQLSRPFGYAWLRSGTPGEYRYELAQDLRSQLLEEELRNRDRHAALLALDREIQRHRPYLNLSPDEALARVESAPPAEKQLLADMAGKGWAAFQLYDRLSAQDMTTLQAGHSLMFRAAPEPGERPLLPDVAQRMLQPFRDWFVVKGEQGYDGAPDKDFPGAVPVPAVASAQPWIEMRIEENELGRTVLFAEVGWTIPNPGFRDARGSNGTHRATGESPALLRPDNAAANARLAQEPSLKRTVSLSPDPTPGPSPKGRGVPIAVASTRLPSPSRRGAGGEVRTEPKVTTADALEALHRATGMPIIADYYTRLYKLSAVTVRDQPLFDALNHVADAMRLRWRKEGEWLQFRSASYYHDRVKEVPNRVLARWVEARRRQGVLTIDDLCEIAQLPDTQLSGHDTSEGVRELLGLVEWDLVRNGNLRPILRFLAAFTPEQRQETMSAAGLPFAKMPLAQQQWFITYVLQSDDGPLQTLEELAGATLRLEYSHEGAFQWGGPGRGGYLRWVVPMTPGPEGRRVLRPPVREQTREAVLQAVRRVDPKIREVLLQWKRKNDPRLDDSARVIEDGEIFPTRLDLTFAFIPGSSNARPIRVTTSDGNMINVVR